jgi:hypothetical protein
MLGIDFRKQKSVLLGNLFNRGSRLKGIGFAFNLFGNSEAA